MYKPEPIDTSNVELPQDIKDLIELLAKNAHDNWALKRLEEGWEFAPVRDNGNKKNPCLVPYEDLPEEEKEYDRKLAEESIKVIMALGYKIEK